MENSSSATGTRAKSAMRALEVLDLLSTHTEGLGFGELARSLEVPKSSLHELLSVLVDRSYVEFNTASRSYTLGIRTWENGQAYLRHHDLIRMARAVMEEMVEEINETVQLAVLDGIENVYLAKADCSHALRLQSEVGRRLYAHGTGLGKVLLAALPEDECRKRLRNRSLPSFTPRTITALLPLLAELALVRERGFAVDDEEYTPGIRCVAVAVRDHRDVVVAAMSVSIPIFRADRTRLVHALASLAAGSLAVARRLGSNQADALLQTLCDPAQAQIALDLALRRPEFEEVAPVL